jgi:hypothetical protein
MPEAPATTTAPVTTAEPATTTSAPATTERTYTESEFKSLQSQYDEAARTVRNAEMFIELDPDVKERLGLFGRSFTEKKPYQDLVKEWEASKASKNKPVETVKPAEPAFNPDLVRELVRNETKTLTQPFIEAQARQSTKETQEAIMKANPWVTEKDWQTYDQRFTDHCQKKAQEIMKANYPRVSEKQAFDMAVNDFVNVPDQMLFDHFMKDAITESVLGKRRVAPKLPEGMVDGITTGKDGDVLEKARRAYKAIEGNAEGVAKLISEYAPQLGVDPNDRAGITKLYSLISK